MLNEDRIRLMTKMAAFEKKDASKSISVYNYYKTDYISYNILKSVISATIAYILCLVLWALYKVDFFVKNINKIDLLAMGEDILKGYAVFMIAYIIISYIVFAHKYLRAKNNIKTYYGHLKRLGKLYEKEEKRLGNNTLGRGK